MSPRMARTVLEVGLGLAVLIFFLALASAQDDCTVTFMTLNQCLDFIVGKSSTVSPSCCPAFDTVLQTRPECLCSLLNQQASPLGIKINQTRALELPGKCGIPAPPVSHCNSVVGEMAAASSTATPASPADTPSEPPTTAPVPSKPSGSESNTTTPSSNGNSNKSTAKSIFLLAAAFLAIY